MLELLKKYQTLLSLVNVKTLSSDKLKSILMLAGINIDTNVSEVIVEMLKNAGKQQNLTSIPQILMDPAIANELSSLISAVPSVTEGSGEKQGISERIHPDSLIECTHCGRRIHLRTAVQRMKDSQGN